MSSESVTKPRKKREEKKVGELGGKSRRTERIEATCMRLIDNHRQVVSSEKGAEVTSARYHQCRPTKRRSIIFRQSKSEIARPFPRATRAAIIGIKAGVNKFRITSNPISLSFTMFVESKAPKECEQFFSFPETYQEYLYVKGNGRLLI